jgi:hypothetical protein
MRRPVALLALALVPATALANIAAPSHAGDPAGEARGDFARLAILAEVLRFDLRPLARGERVEVTVRYRIRNLEAAARTLSMAFRTPGVEDGTVALDGRRLPHQAVLAPPTSQPGQAEPPPRERELIFSASLAARGEHQIDVAYRMLPARETAGSLYWRHGILYDLSPARQWGSFGTLDVEVLAPPGWQVESDPVLERQGDRLQRRFQGLPAANLVLSASRRREYSWGWVFILLGGLGGAVGAFALAWRRGKRSGGSKIPALFPGLGYGVLGAVVSFLLAMAGLALWGALLDAQQVSSRELYSYSLALTFLGLPGGVVLTVAVAITYASARRRSTVAYE